MKARATRATPSGIPRSRAKRTRSDRRGRDAYVETSRRGFRHLTASIGRTIRSVERFNRQIKRASAAFAKYRDQIRPEYVPIMADGNLVPEHVVAEIIREIERIPGASVVSGSLRYNTTPHAATEPKP